MPELTLLNKNEFKDLAIKSPRDRQKLIKMLGRDGPSFKQDFIAELAAKLNPTSFKEVLKKTYFTDPSMPGRNFAETFTEAFSSRPLAGLPQTAYLQIAVENLNREIDSVKVATSSLLKHGELVAGLHNEVIEPIAELVKATGFSKIALMKLFQLEVVSYNLTTEDKELKAEIYKAGRVRGLGDTLMIIDQCIQPRGRPFRTLLSYSTQINFGKDYYSSYREEFSDSFCPFPIFETQVNGFCKLLAGFSLADQLVGVSGLYDIARYRGWSVASQIDVFASQELLEQFARRATADVQQRFFEAILPKNGTDYDIYNASVANRDFDLARNFRNNADALLLPIISDSLTTSSEPNGSKKLKEERRSELDNSMVQSSNTSCSVCSHENLKLSFLLRLLDFRRAWPTDFNINSVALGNVLESGMPLHRFLQAQEIEKLALDASQRDDNLAVLMLRYLPVIKEYSEDADYLFLRALEDAVEGDSSTSLVGFIEELADSNPKFATGLILALSPRRLQKCYRCVANYQEMTSTHRKLLEVAARITGDLDLVIQADQIALDEKLASARAHFDSSRIFVDEVLFKNWALEEVSPSLQALRKHVMLYSPELPDNPTTDEIAASMKSGALETIVGILKEHFVDLPIKDAFRTFCLDHYFGVDSFLGRRIRHNATHGLLLGQLDKICLGAMEKDPQFEFEIHQAYNSWRAEYLQEVDRLVSDRFRFKTDEFPNGVLSPYFESTKGKIADVEMDLISQTIVNVKPEIVIQNMITGFWGILDSELRKMRQFLRSEFTQATLECVDRHFDNMSSPTMAVAADLKVRLMERIERLASWYSPFSPADISISPSDLAQMVWNDGEDVTGYRKLEISGNAAQSLVTGSNVRTLYDCLHVVLVNAVKHSNGHNVVTLHFETDSADPEGAHELRISIMSALSESPEDFERSSEKFNEMKAIVDSSEVSKEVMVVQGYSGLRKLQYLLFRTRRLETLKLVWIAEEIGISFDIPVNFVGHATDDRVS